MDQLVVRQGRCRDRLCDLQRGAKAGTSEIDGQPQRVTGLRCAADSDIEGGRTVAAVDRDRLTEYFQDLLHRRGEAGQVGHMVRSRTIVDAQALGRFRVDQLGKREVG